MVTKGFNAFFLGVGVIFLFLFAFKFAIAVFAGIGVLCFLDHYSK